MDRNADNIRLFAAKLRKHPSFMLACDPWPYNMNFLFIPKRIRLMIEEAGIRT